MKKITLVLALIVCTASAPVRANDVVFNLYKDKVSQLLQQYSAVITEMLMNQIIKGDRELRMDVVSAVLKSMDICTEGVKNKLRGMEFPAEAREFADRCIGKNFTATEYTTMLCEIIYDKLVKMSQETPDKVQLNGDIERIKSDISCRVNDALERKTMQDDPYTYFKDRTFSMLKYLGSKGCKTYVDILARIAQKIEKGEAVSVYDVRELTYFFKRDFSALKSSGEFQAPHRAQLIANLRFTDEQFLQMVIDLIAAEVEIERPGADPVLMQMAAPAPAAVAAIDAAVATRLAEETAARKARIAEQVRQAVVAAIADAKAYSRVRAYA